MTADGAVAEPRTILIADALVVDGTGAPARPGSVLVEDGRVSRIDAPDAAPPRGALVIDAGGRAVAPGFIDMHAHSDLAVLSDPVHLAKTSQGVTTEVVGQDGISYAPTTDETMDAVRRQIAGWNGVPESVDFAWRSVGEYLDAVDDARPAANVAYLVPQGTVRMNVVGHDRRPATPAEIDAMRGQVATGMREGAFGMSAGLSYVPSMFAGTDELVSLCETVAEHGGYFAPHQRSYGKGALEGYAEMIEIAERSGCPLHLTHATMNFGVNKGRAAEFIALVDAALERGVDVTLDTYPYLPGATTLAALLPSWVAQGGPEETLRQLAEPSVRARLAHELNVTGTDGCHGVIADWPTVEISGVRNQGLAGYVGRTVAQIAEDEGRPAEEVCFDILIRDELATTILQHVGHEENVRAIMRHARHMGGSDGILVGAKPHPRAWGTFPRYLGHYARDERILGIEDAVAHLSGRPARRLGLADRGLVAPGMIADLVVFDPATVRDRSTFPEPRRQADGIPWVLVGGRPIIAEGERTEARAGRALRHEARRPR